MISGASKILSKDGPVALLSITKMLHKIQENYGLTLATYYLCQYGIQKIETFRNNVCPRYPIFPFFYVDFEYMFLKYVCGDED